MTAGVQSIKRAARLTVASLLALWLTGAAHAVCCVSDPASAALTRAANQQAADAAMPACHRAAHHQQHQTTTARGADNGTTSSALHAFALPGVARELPRCCEAASQVAAHNPRPRIARASSVAASSALVPRTVASSFDKSAARPVSCLPDRVGTYLRCRVLLI